MKSFDFYKERAVNAAEEGLVEYKPGDKSGSELWEEITTGEIFQDKYKRTVAVLSLLKQLMPDWLGQYAEDFRKSKFEEKLPIVDSYELKGLVGKGADKEVYLLDSKKSSQPSFVIKIDNFKGSLEELLAQVKKMQGETSQARKDFSLLPELVAEEQIMIGQNFKTPLPAIMVLQKYVGHDSKDIFDIPGVELAELLVSDPELKNKFLIFVDQMHSCFKLKGKVIDISGAGNLLLVKDDNEKYDLRLIDAHSHVNLSGENEERIERTTEKMDFLLKIAAAVR